MPQPRPAPLSHIARFMEPIAAWSRKMYPSQLAPSPQVRPVPPSVSVEFKKHATAMAMARRSPPVASPPARGRAGVTEWSHEYAMRRSASLSQGSQSWLPPWQRPTGLHGLSSSFYRQ